MEKLRCPFCNERFTAGKVWQDHFHICPERTQGATTRGDQAASLTSQIRSIEKRMKDDQKEIERLRHEVATLRGKNHQLEERIANVKKAIAE